MNSVDKSSKDLVTEWKHFHVKNPEVYELFKRFAFEAINKGHLRLSSEMIINRIRWETSVVTSDKDYKINNELDHSLQCCIIVLNNFFILIKKKS